MNINKRIIAVRCTIDVLEQAMIILTKSADGFMSRPIDYTIINRDALIKVEISGHDYPYMRNKMRSEMDALLQSHNRKQQKTPTFSKDYLEWVKQSGLPHLTNNQHRFAEWLLHHDNREVMSQIGNMDDVFTSIRKWIKNEQSKISPSEPLSHTKP